MYSRNFILSFVFSFLFANTGFSQISVHRTLTGGSTAARAVAATMSGGYIFTGEGLSVVKTDGLGDIVWSNTYAGTIGRSILELPGEKYLVVGETGNDLYAMKLDANGIVLWGRAIGGTNSDYGWSVQEAVDDGYIICGYTKSFGQGGTDVYLIRLADDGSIIWSKTYGGSGNEYGRSVLALSDGSFVVCGDTYSYGAGSSDIYLFKTDANGVLLWSKTFGGTTYELGYSVEEASDGGYVVCGYTNSNGQGGNDGFLLKVNSSGDMKWGKTYGGTGNDYCWSVKRSNAGGYIISGYTNSFGAGNNDVYLIKTDTAGSVEWSKNYNGGLNEYGMDVFPLTGGDYIVCGWSDSYSVSLQDELYMFRADQNGSNGCNEEDAATLVSSIASSGSGGVEADAASIVATLESITPLLMGVRVVCDSVNATAPEIFKDDDVEILVYPNPFESYATFEISGIDPGKQLDLTIFNALGQTVKIHSAPAKDEIVIDRGGLVEGIYFYQVRTGSALLGAGKLVIH